VIVWTFVALAAMYAGAHLWESIGMGAFAAFFGGPGFGGMLGAVTYIERQHAASTKNARVVAPEEQDADGSNSEPETAALEPVRQKIQLERGRTREQREMTAGVRPRRPGRLGGATATAREQPAHPSMKAFVLIVVVVIVLVALAAISTFGQR